MENIVTRSQLALMRGVSKKFVTTECKEGGAFRLALAGQRVNAGHPVVREWLAHRQEVLAAKQAPAKKAPTKKAAKKTARKVTKKAPARKKPAEFDDAVQVLEGYPDDKSSGSAEALKQLSLAEIERRFGGEPQFSNWLKDVALTETIIERRLKNEVTRGSLIARDFVVTHLLGLIEETNQRLLSDLPKTLAREIQNHAKAGIALEESERSVRSALGKSLDAVKSKVTRQLSKV